MPDKFDEMSTEEIVRYVTRQDVTVEELWALREALVQRFFETESAGGGGPEQNEHMTCGPHFKFEAQ